MAQVIHLQGIVQEVAVMNGLKGNSTTLEKDLKQYSNAAGAQRE